MLWFRVEMLDARSASAVCYNIHPPPFRRGGQLQCSQTQTSKLRGVDGARIRGLRVWGTAFRVSGLGVKAPSGASAEEASVGVGADRVVVAVVRVVGTLVVITPETIAIPPATRTESTVLRNAFICDPAALRRGWARRVFQPLGLLATSADIHRRGLGS